MVNPIQVSKFAGLGSMWGFFRIISIVMASGIIIFPIFFGLYTGFTTHNWDDFASATGGKLLSTDRDTKLTTDKLIEAKSTSKYDFIDIDNMRNRIWTNLSIMAIIFYLVFLLFKFIWNKLISTGEANVGFGAYAIIIILTLMVMCFLQFGWLIYESKFINDEGFFDNIHIPEAIPFYGTVHFIRNYDALAVSGSKSPEEINEVIENTATSNVLDIYG